MAEEPINTDALRGLPKAIADTRANVAGATRQPDGSFLADTVVVTIDPAENATNPAGSLFGPEEYSLLKSEENLAPNFRVDRGLGQSSSNVEYTGAVPQPNFTGVGVGAAGVGGQGAINPNDQIGPAFGGGETRGTGGIGGDRAITGPSEQIGPDFGTGNAVGVGAAGVGGQGAVTEGAPVGPNFGNGGTGTGPTTPGGGGYSPERVQTAPTPSPQRAVSEDWRFRIGLMPGSEVLYKDGNRDSILAPLIKTDGVIFPYTPQLAINYTANYEKKNPTHSNYASYFYHSSEVQDVQVNATFTAQSTDEADYMIAMIHFFRSATKMFYGQDANKGTPPPLVSVTGLGPNQFNFHKAIIKQFNYVLPEDVDYIRTSEAGVNSIRAQSTRAKLQGGGGNYGIFGTASRIGRLFGIGATAGAENSFQAANEGTNLARAGATYVPTKIEVSLILYPVVTRAEQSTQFSLKDYASGKGLSQRGQW